jgi:hypothetical protein
MPKLASGVVLSSSAETLRIRLTSGTVVEAPPRPELNYMDLVHVAYDFTNHEVREVLLPNEVTTIDPLVEIREEPEEIGNEAEVQHLLDKSESLEF